MALALAYVESWFSKYKLSNHHLNVSSLITTTVAPSWSLPPFGKLKLSTSMQRLIEPTVLSA
ncbi:hypothetical protein PanWU01x14_243890 [Parasponia andersonii]|uniref:Uncharacterized protein n=1 Tax=Parasponia andersonii TaxID=3476 RepID=A0A2P5BF64_PARAD|nr:hypothetical protein PanWU01x14_243890 [Parasponia andersonii]